MPGTTVERGSEGSLDGGWRGIGASRVERQLGSWGRTEWSGCDAALPPRMGCGAAGDEETSKQDQARN